MSHCASCLKWASNLAQLKDCLLYETKFKCHLLWEAFWEFARQCGYSFLCPFLAQDSSIFSHREGVPMI